MERGMGPITTTQGGRFHPGVAVCVAVRVEQGRKRRKVHEAEGGGRVIGEETEIENVKMKYMYNYSSNLGKTEITKKQ